MNSLKEKIKNKYYHYYERIIMRWYNFNFPRLDKNIDQVKKSAQNKDNHGNVSGNIQPFFDSVHKAGIKPSASTILDYGCGTGKILILSCFLKFNKIIGIELDDEGIKIAKENVAKINSSSSVELQKIDASLYKVPVEVNVIYFFNPFGKETMIQVAKNIKESYLTYQRSITIIYQNPVEKDVLLDYGFKEIYRKSLDHSKPYYSILRID